MKFLDFVQRRGAPDFAPEHLLVGLPEIFRQEGIDDRIDGRVAVGQAVGSYPEDEGGIGKRKCAELIPQIDHMVWKPGNAEHHDHHEYRLGGLGRGEQVKRHIDHCLVLTPTYTFTTPASNRLPQRTAVYHSVQIFDFH